MRGLERTKLERGGTNYEGSKRNMRNMRVDLNPSNEVSLHDFGKGNI